MSYPYSSLFLDAFLAKQRLAQVFRDQAAESPPLLVRASQQRSHEIVVENAVRVACSAVGVEALDSSATALHEIRQEPRVERRRKRSNRLTGVVEAEHLAGVWHSSQRNPGTFDVCEEMK